jgi:hypothetical protein
MDEDPLDDGKSGSKGGEAEFGGYAGFNQVWFRYLLALTKEAGVPIEGVTDIEDQIDDWNAQVEGKVKLPAKKAMSSLCVTLVRIPMGPKERALRRLLCRLAEAMFAYWLCAFGSTGKGSHLFPFAAKLNTDIYGDGQPELMGTLTHSPLTEQLGTEEFGTLRQSRFEDLMVEYHNIYGINVPDDMVMLAWDRYRFDTLRQREDRTRRNDALSAAQVTAGREEKNASQKETRAN